MGLLERILIRAAVAKAADIIADERARPPDPLRWIKRGAFLAVLVIGWVFIAWSNRFYLSAPTVFLCLGYLAVLATVVTLWRTGAMVVDDAADDDPEVAPSRYEVVRAELEREKKGLLKAIKEAEFDREMGKLSAADADQMIAVYRARAIELIKALDELGGEAARTPREQIERELHARLELEAKLEQAKVKGATEAVASKQAFAPFKPGKGKGKQASTTEAAKAADPVTAADPDTADAAAPATGAEPAAATPASDRAKEASS